MAEIDDLEQIARNPQADVPRWRAAAWYESQGDFDRAAFIRMQLQLAQLAALQPGLVIALAPQSFLLQRHDIAGDELTGGVANGPLLVAELKVHVIKLAV